MRLKLSFLKSPPFAGLGYGVLWGLLWPTSQPDWTLQFGLRFDF